VNERADVLFDYDRATEVVPAGDGLWSASIHDGWDIHGNANGGYLMGIAARAMSAACSRAHPVSVTMHFLAPATPGHVAVRTSITRDGGRLASVAATIERDGSPIATAIGLFSRAAPVEAPDRHLAPPADGWTPFEECPARPSAAAPALMRRLDVRLEPADAGFVVAPTGRPLLRGWFAFADGHSEIHKWTDPRTTPVLRQGQQLALNQPQPNNRDVLWVQDRTTRLTTGR
jgi:hypothetical protein